MSRSVFYTKVNALCTRGKVDTHSVPQKGKRKRSGFRETPLQA